MTYANSRTARLVASNCCVCGRPLVDAVSVDMGIGPVCRQRHGFDILVDERARAEANEIVYAIACAQAITAEQASRLQDLGFTQLAARILDRLGRRMPHVNITVFTNVWRGRDYHRIAITAPYNAGATSAWRSISGRHWNRDMRRNEIPADTLALRRLQSLLANHYSDALVEIERKPGHPADALLDSLNGRTRPVTKEIECQDCHSSGRRGNRLCATCDGEGFVLAAQ